MKFKIHRTRYGSYSEIRPLDAAKQEEVPQVDWRGQDVGLEKVWTVEVDTIEQLLALVEQEGSVIISGPDKHDGLPEIEIYDDYRE